MQKEINYYMNEAGEVLDSMEMFGLVWDEVKRQFINEKTIEFLSHNALTECLLEQFHYQLNNNGWRALRLANKLCYKCGGEAYIEEKLDYPYYCPVCGENLYEFETVNRGETLKIDDNIAFIIDGGYYSNDDDGELLFPHTSLTWTLYNNGLKACGELSDDEIMDGVYIKYGRAYATVNFDNKVFPVNL